MASAREEEGEEPTTSAKQGPEWVVPEIGEVVELIVEMGKKNTPPSQIGMTLRDVYGVPSVKDFTGKTISTILRENGLAPQIPGDLMALLKKAYEVRKHLEEHRRDLHSKRGLLLTESKIRGLARYYRRAGRLPPDWRYDPSKLEMIIT